MKRPRGRPPKPEGEKYVTKAFKFPPALWAEIEEYIPEGERSEIIRGCLTRAVARRKREAQGQEPEG